MRHKSETLLAVLTLVLTLTHFVLETAYHFKYGQPLQALIVDYIWNALAIFAAVISLKIRPKSAAGLLAASWAFALGFGWRSVFGRLALTDADRAAGNGEPVYITYVLVAALCLIVIFLIWSLTLAYRQSVRSQNTQ